MKEFDHWMDAASYKMALEASGTGVADMVTTWTPVSDILKHNEVTPGCSVDVPSSLTWEQLSLALTVVPKDMKVEALRTQATDSSITLHIVLRDA